MLQQAGIQLKDSVVILKWKMNCIIQNLPLKKPGYFGAISIVRSPGLLLPDIKLEPSEQGSLGILCCSGLIWWIGEASRRQAEMENSQPLAQYHEAQNYSAESELFLFNVWLSLWTEHSGREWKGSALSGFGWVSYGASMCAWKSWEGWIGIKYDHLSKLVHSTAQPSVITQPSMMVRLPRKETSGRNAKLQVRREFRRNNDVQKILNELTPGVWQVNINTWSSRKDRSAIFHN